VGRRECELRVSLLGPLERCCVVLCRANRKMGVDNRYMEIMNLCVLHLSDVERDNGTGVDREELVQWYLEQKEVDFETEEDLENERELIGKALTRLAKVCLGFYAYACE
jgi:hypothetical protein